MAVTFTPRTIGGISKNAFEVAAAAGEVGDLIILEEDLMQVDKTFLNIVDSTTIDGVPSPTFVQKLAATTLPNGRKADVFFASRIFDENILAARYAKQLVKADVVAAVQDIAADVAAIEGRVTALEQAV